MREYIMQIIILVASIIALPVISHFLFKDSPDNPIEQAEEAIIEQETGISIDLSPGDK